MTNAPLPNLNFINEGFYAELVSPAKLDHLLADGWRHFGSHFFRYNLNLYREEIVRVIPLRIRLANFHLSRGQHRVLKRNTDLTIVYAPIDLTDEIHKLFHRHKTRFDHSVPDSIYNFLSDDAANCPTDCFQIEARDSDAQLLAVSFFDVGETSVSAIYGCFDPEIINRSLGIFTMLKVIEFAASNGKKFYYQGYAYEGESFYDYKKRFAGTEAFDWNGVWKPL